VTSLGMSGDLTNSAGDVLLTSGTSQAITHTGGADEDLVISSGGNVDIQAVVVSTAGATSGVTSLGMSGDLTNSAGDVLLTSGTSQAITHTGGADEDLVISSGGNVDIQAVVVSTAGATSGVTSLTMTGTLSLDGAGAQAITHTGNGATDLTISSSGGDVLIEGISFSGSDISGVNTLSAGGNVVLRTQQAAVSDILLINDPGDDVIGSLSVSGTYSQVEVQALRDECEKLRDWLDETRAQVNLLLARVRTHGLIAT